MQLLYTFILCIPWYVLHKSDDSLLAVWRRPKEKRETNTSRRGAAPPAKQRPFSGERVQRVHVCRVLTGTSCQPSVAARSAYLVGREENILSYPTFRYSKQRSLLFRRKLLDRWCAKAPRRGQGHVVRRSYKYDHGQQLPYILQDRDPTIAQAWIRGPTPPRRPPRCSWAQELQVTKFLS